jgi:hypothetical protein
MSDKKINLKSDVPAKLAFIQNLLLVQGFDEARITGQPADITARKGDQIFYFEIKFTAQSKSYFGAATLTEWDVALAREENYRFVIATMKNDDWMFREYTPQEFMQFSYIPPFKVFFNVPVGDHRIPILKVPRLKVASKRVQMTRDRMSAMVAIYKKFRSELS